MATIAHCREALERILLEYASIPFAYGEIVCEALIDCERDRFALMNTGWDEGKRIHGCIVHADIIDGKIWIQYDGTEEGIAKELVAAGVPKDQIVLAFHAPELRKYTDFAAA